MIPEWLSHLDQRLEAMSVGRRLVSSLGYDPEAIELAVHAPGQGYTAERPALPFELSVQPGPGAETEMRAPGVVLRGEAQVSNHLHPLLPMPNATFGLELALMPQAQSEDLLRDPVHDAQEAARDAPPIWVRVIAGMRHRSMHSELQRIFGGADVGAQVRALVFTARIMGHRMTRTPDRYRAPGTGSWTVLRVIDPSDAWLALDLTSGWGEWFSCGIDDRSRQMGSVLNGLFA